jgi:hypothetical protein
MAGFNQVRIGNIRRTVNHEGEIAYSPLSDEQKLYSLCAGNLLEDNFYTSKSKTVQEILDTIPKCDFRFVAGLAAYLRKEMYLRSVPLLLLVGLARIRKLQAYMVWNVISRADEIKELLQAYREIEGKQDMKQINMALKKGVAKAMGKFNAYHYRKYNKQGKEALTFKDALRITHPAPETVEQEETYRAIKEDNLPPIETWEIVISSAQDKTQGWEYVVNTGKLPYMAALRNIRNIIQAGVSEQTINNLLEFLADEKQILNSKQFPFRWYSAYHQIKQAFDGGDMSIHIKRVRQSLEKAIQTSVANIPGFEELKDNRVLIACDVSGSMMKPLSKRSSMHLGQVGLVLGSLLSSKLPNVVTGYFGDNWKVQGFGDTVLPGIDFDSIEGTVGYATYAYKVLGWAIQNNVDFDKVMFFSDNQMYRDTHPDQGNRSVFFEDQWKQYKKMFPNAQLYLFDLSNYITTPVDLIGRDIYYISGWSPNIFKVLRDLNSWQKVRDYIATFNHIDEKYSPRWYRHRHAA